MRSVPVVLVQPVRQLGGAMLGGWVGLGVGADRADGAVSCDPRDRTALPRDSA